MIIDTKLEGVHGSDIVILSVLIDKYGTEDERGHKMVEITKLDVIKLMEKFPRLYISDDEMTESTQYKLVYGNS